MCYLFTEEDRSAVLFRKVVLKIVIYCFLFFVGNMPSGLWQNEKLMWKNAENEDIVYPVALFSLDFENLTAKFRHSLARCTACCFL